MIVFVNHAQVLSYDLSSGKEEEMPDMNIPRMDFVSILVGKYIYVFGGRNQTGPMSSCERYFYSPS